MYTLWLLNKWGWREVCSGPLWVVARESRRWPYVAREITAARLGAKQTAGFPG